MRPTTCIFHHTKLLHQPVVDLDFDSLGHCHPNQRYFRLCDHIIIADCTMIVRHLVPLFLCLLALVAEHMTNLVPSQVIRHFNPDSTFLR